MSKGIAGIEMPHLPSESFSLPSLQVFQCKMLNELIKCKMCSKKGHPIPDICNPDMIFTVNPDASHILNVTVVEAHKITKGWVGDLVDKPDPYVVLKIPHSPNGKKRTKHFNNTSSPTWNEVFTFVLDPEKQHELEITLMDANYIKDQKMGCEKIDVSILTLNEEKEIAVKFGASTEIVLKLFLSIDHNPDLRYGLSLCEKEKEFKKHRRKFVMDVINKMLGEDGPTSESEVPIVGVIGSGGGFRAMTAFSGAFKALQDSKIIDCITYVAGLSGSAWYLSTLYSHPEFPTISPAEIQDELKASIRHSPFWLLSPRSMYRYIKSIKTKHRNGQPVSFTDFFGHLLGDTLLKGRCNALLSDQQMKVEGGNVPLPLYTCLHVKSNVSAKVFQDWLEFSPYEIGISKYAAFMKTEHFGSKLFKGRLVKRHPEYPLHYLQGIWGSAFSILFKRLIQERTKLTLDISACMDSDEDDVYFDAEEELQDNEEDTLRDALETLDLTPDDTDVVQTDSEEETDEKELEVESPTEKGVTSLGFWKEFVNCVFSSSILDTRKGRAGRILNPLRGLSLVPCFPFSPFSPTSPNDDMLFKGLTEPAPTHSKTLYLVDGGLTFNLPFPLLLRPQRAVDLYLTFDFSSRDSDNSLPFKELILSEKWARINNCIFPPVLDLVAEYATQPPKECYVFKHPTNELCPIIIHFPLFNLDFRNFSKPGVPRETEEELNFADFSIFNDPKKTYSIFNFKYPPQQFERLAQLMEFNVLNNIDVIKENLAVIVKRKKNCMPQSSMVLKEQPQKKLSSVTEQN